MTDREIKAATANRVHKAAKSRVMAALQGIDLKDDSCFGYELSRRNKKGKLYNHYKEEEKKKTNMEALHEVLRGGGAVLEDRAVTGDAHPHVLGVPDERGCIFLLRGSRPQRRHVV